MTSRTFVVFSALVAALGGLLFGFDTAVISGTTDALQRVFALDEFGLGFAVTSALIGTIVGAFTAGPPAERLGRRRVLFVLALLFLVGAVGSAVATSLPVFVLFRFLGGLGVGGASVVSPLYIAEIAPARLRGRLVALNQLNIVAGILIAFLSNVLIARALPADAAWRWMLGVQAVPAALFFVLLFLVPESPRWLAKQGRVDEARRVLARLRDAAGDAAGEGGTRGAEAELAAILASLAEGHTAGDATGVHARLFQRRYARPIFLAVTVAAFNQLSGINALLYYAPRVFRQAGSGADAALLESVAVGGTNLVFTVLALFVIDRFGRRPLLALGGLGASVSLGLAAAGFYRAEAGGFSGGLVLAGLLGFIAFHAIGQGAVIWVFISEIFPNAVREKGQALGSFTHWVMAALISWTFPVMAQASGGHAFAFFAGMMLLQFIFAWRIMPETKGLSLEALQERLGMDGGARTLAGALLALLALGAAPAPVPAQAPAPAPAPAAAPTYTERYRPQYHFTPAANWMNDPNGMVYYDGEYHLFYQHNPFGNRWGHMSWGHAVSPDLVHWQHLPVAIPEADHVMAFSGSAVVDWQNTSGFGQGGRPPLVAIYTGHRTDRPSQSQYLAYSNDRGRSWTRYAGNPVLDIGSAEFRDPKVMWHAPTRQWVMTVVLATAHTVRFYGSPDLKRWTPLSDFGPAAAVGGVWECPDLFELPVDGNPANTRWVLVVNLNPGGIAGGSAAQYFVGRFDGTRFTADSAVPRTANPGAPGVRWADYGKDFYAAVSWSDVPRADGRRLWLGWMNNWQYANDIPTAPWRSAMSVPRTLALTSTPQGIRLVQQPVRELERLRGPPRQLAARTIAEGSTALAAHGIAGQALEIAATFEVDTAGAKAGARAGAATEFGLKVRTGRGQDGRPEETVIGIDPRAGQLVVDRTRSGQTAFHHDFSARETAPLPVENGRVRLHIFVDWSSVEVFAGDGRVVVTDQIFPSPASDGVELYATGGTARLVSLEAWPMASAWAATSAARARRGGARR